MKIHKEHSRQISNSIRFSGLDFDDEVNEETRIHTANWTSLGFHSAVTASYYSCSFLDLSSQAGCKWT